VKKLCMVKCTLTRVWPIARAACPPSHIRPTELLGLNIPANVAAAMIADVRGIVLVYSIYSLQLGCRD